MRFSDRREAGRRLAALLADAGLQDPLVLALPRGGVPVAYEIATALGAPLDVFVARKVGAPGHPEYGIGAVAEGGTGVVDAWAAQALGLTQEDFDRRAADEQREVERRVQEYRGERRLPALAGRDVVLVDDGLATGVTAEAALRALRAQEPRRLILAVPVCAPETARRLRGLADEVICVASPPDFRAVGLWYDDFGQTSDEEVRDLLARAHAGTGP
jgi:predicted phosphoribosyltransferase